MTDRGAGSIGSPSTLAVTFDGTPATTGGPIALDARWKSGAAKIDLGIEFEELGTSGWSLHYDDVAVTGQ